MLQPCSLAKRATIAVPVIDTLDIMVQKSNISAGETAQWVSYLLCTCEHPSLNPQNPCKTKMLSVPGKMGGRMKRIFKSLQATWPDIHSLHIGESLSRVSELAQQVTALDGKPANLSAVLQSHMVDR